MKKLLVARKHIVKLFFLVCICLGLGFVALAQKARKEKISYPSNTRVFYGQASFYANKFNGKRTANGEIFSQNKYTCACNVLPLGTWVKVTNVRNGKSVVVKITDRIHPKMKRLVDLSKVAANKLGYVSNGLTRVKVEVIGKNKPQ